MSAVPQAVPKPRNLSHIAVGVSDMDASLAFYCDVIGLEVAVDHIEDMRHPRFKTYRRGVYLRWSGGDDDAFVVLDQTLGEHGDRGRAKQLFEIGAHHFGFWVDDVDAIVARARVAGHPVLIDPLDSDSGGYDLPAMMKRLEQPNEHCKVLVAPQAPAQARANAVET